MIVDIIYRANGDKESISPKNGKYYTLPELQQIVGGYIEQVTPRGSEDSLIVNEEGKLLGLRHNATATSWLRNHGIYDDYIVGDALLVDNKRIR